MKTAVVMVLSALAGAGVVLFYHRRLIKLLRAKIHTLQNGSDVPPKNKIETGKLIIWVSLIMGFLWVCCSYVLAYTDHNQIAESLSQAAVTEIIGVVLAYSIKSTLENLSKHNHWPDKPPAACDGEEPEPVQQDPTDIG